MKLSIVVTLKKEVLDPQGKVIERTLHNLGFNDVHDVRQGKYFEVEVDKKNFKEAKSRLEEVCKKLLANLVIEDYKIVREL